MESIRGDYVVTCDPSKIDLEVVAGFLAESYWANGIPFETVERSVRNSLCFALLKRSQQVGFARVITDYSTIAYLGDVFILPDHRGLGLGQWLIGCVTSHPRLRGLRRWILATRDAHALYEKFGFRRLKHPERFMEIHDPDIYSGRRG